MTVTLRPLVATDSERVLGWRNADHVAAYMYTDHLIGPDEHARWLKAAGASGVDATRGVFFNQMSMAIAAAWDWSRRASPTFLISSSLRRCLAMSMPAHNR